MNNQTKLKSIICVLLLCCTLVYASTTHRAYIQSDGSETCPDLQAAKTSTGLYNLIFIAGFTHLGGYVIPHTSGNTATVTTVSSQEANVQIQDSGGNPVDDSFTIVYIEK